ncbi:hypothetical protein DNFV4_03638 [Nitrospira tepida]|uniref:Uncharacterized protein n=1 Tax=Nitrospira tepida TaxID=2973512 RepID=A0AA86N205_9BACT|nr:hypothetical protein [Nitrospira tepida]CAI4033204.1 hypothetical protein DNFV4_03638 [Nitrospira tepida]
MGKRMVGQAGMVLAVVMAATVWMGATVSWADSINVEGLPKEPAAYKAKVDEILAKVDQVIGKLKGDQKNFAVVADLMMTRDNVAREIYKVQNKPEGSKWGAEMRESVDDMLKLLAVQYEKATSL